MRDLWRRQDEGDVQYGHRDMAMELCDSSGSLQVTLQGRLEYCPVLGVRLRSLSESLLWRTRKIAVANLGKGLVEDPLKAPHEFLSSGSRKVTVLCFLSAPHDCLRCFIPFVPALRPRP